MWLESKMAVELEENRVFKTTSLGPQNKVQHKLFYLFKLKYIKNKYRIAKTFFFFKTDGPCQIWLCFVVRRNTNIVVPKVAIKISGQWVSNYKNYISRMEHVFQQNILPSTQNLENC